MYFYLKCSVKWGIQNTNFKLSTNVKMCHVQSLEKDFYLGAPISFDCDFTPMATII